MWRARDRRGSNFWRMDPYVLALGVIAFASLFLSVFRLIIQALDQITRSVTLRVFNYSSHPITGRTAYFYSGTSDIIPPDQLQRQGYLRYSARKTKGPTASGTVGVVTYETETGNTVAIMFSVPFDYVLYTNWWNVKIYQGKRQANYAMYRELYYRSNALKGNDEWRDIKDKRMQFGIEARCVMSSSGNATLHVHLHDEHPHHGVTPIILPHLTALQLSSLTPGMELGVNVLDDVLESLSAVVRTIAIGVSNITGATWKAKNVYFVSGTSDVVPPGRVADGKSLLYSARKTRGPIVRGAVGVIAYDTSRGETLGILFSVPFDYNLFDNEWNVGLFEADVKADSEMYTALRCSGQNKTENKMYETVCQSDLKKGNDCWTSKVDIGNGYVVSGAMSSSGSATLKILVENPPGRQHLDLDHSIQ